MKNKIYILLPVHNRKEITRGFVECLKAQTFQDYRLVLIDDGSNDGTADMVKESIPSVTVLRGIGDWWWAGSLQSFAVIGSLVSDCQWCPVRRSGPWSQ